MRKRPVPKRAIEIIDSISKLRFFMVIRLIREIVIHKRKRLSKEENFIEIILTNREENISKLNTPMKDSLMYSNTSIFMGIIEKKMMKPKTII